MLRWVVAIAVILVAGCTPPIEVAGSCRAGCNVQGDCEDGEVCSTLGTCLERCSGPSDCEAGETCAASGACKRLEHFCASPDWSSSLAGEFTPCFPYFCDASTGLCKRHAETEADCVPRYELNGDDCLPTMSAEDAELYRKDYWAEHELPGRSFSCERRCATDADCLSGHMCSTRNECVPRRDYCDPDNSADLLSVTLTGDTLGEDGNFARSTRSCGDYACDAVGGDCRTDCVSDFDCDSGFFCQATTRTCVSKA